jgi:hypothetical protein
MNIDFSIPSNPYQTVKIIKDICSKSNCLQMNTFVVNYGFDYSQSICSKPSDFFHIGLIGAIMLNHIKTKPTHISVLTIDYQMIDIYFDQYEGFGIETTDYWIEFKTISEFEKKLNHVLMYI